MSFRKENLTLEQTSKNLQLKPLEQEERTTVDPDIKHFAAS